MVRLLFVLALLATFLRMSRWRVWPLGVMILAVGLGSYYGYPWVIAQSKAQVMQWLTDPVIMQNLAVIQLIETGLLFAIDLQALRQHFGVPVKKAWRYAVWFPGVMVWGATLYVLMICVYAVSHLVDLSLLGLYGSVGMALLFFSMAILVKWVVPEPHLNFELRFIIGIGQVLIGIVITVFCQRLPVLQPHGVLSWRPLLYLIALVVGMAAMGWGVFKIKTKRNHKRTWKY